MPTSTPVRAGWFLAACLLIFAVGPLFAQTVIGISFDEDEEDFESFEAGGIEVVNAPQATPAPPGGVVQPDGERKARRLAIIRGLSFDRRPSAILKTWREPPPVDVPAEFLPADALSAIPPLPVPDAGAAAKPVELPKDGAPPDPAVAAKQAEQAQKEQAAKQAEAAKLKAAEDAAFQKELAALQRQVTLGQWADVQQFISALDRDEAQALYGQMVTSLQTGAMGRMNIEPNLLQQLVQEGSDIYKIQQALSSMGQGPGAAHLEKNLFTMPDMLGLLTAAPGEFDDDALRKLGLILQFTIAAGFDLEALLTSPPVVAARTGSRVVSPAKEPEKETKEAASAVRTPHVLTARDIAKLLTSARQETRAGDFLPTLDEATAATDGAGLNLIARHVLAKYAVDQKSLGLEQAWNATQAVLEIPLPAEPPKEAATPPAQNSPRPEPSGLPPGVMLPGQPAGATASKADAKSPAARYQLAKATRDEALTRAVELAPKVRKELGRKWLDDSFQVRTERGKEILTAIGTATSNNLASHPYDGDYRKKGLELQKTAVDALLVAGDERIAEWREPLTVVAVAWLKEAQVSRDLDNSAGARGWRRDRYGNYFMFDNEGYMPSPYMGRGNVSPIKIEDVLELKPSETWLKHVTADLLPKFDETYARLHLKLQDERLAFPHIERLAAAHPDRAKELAEEFLRVWTTSHNPNEQRDGYNPFYYYMSYERRADRIPLTRSKQQRNLVELAEWVTRLKALPIGTLNETLLTNAFTTAHSKAEVYRLESIESVFGSVDALKPRTLAELIQQMRGNLAGVWRMPDVQRQNSTNRKQRDIRAEVVHGYEVARKVTQGGLEKHPDHWALLLAQAAILHDEIDYEKEAEKSSDFSQRRTEALNLFAAAAKSYVAAVPEIPLDEQTVLPFEMWFYASLGSVDLARITADKTPDLKQPPLIREALLSLPGEAADRHLSQFANNLFTRGTDAKPELKHRYLRAGFEVVGDHKLAREARKLLEYYGDLITEIKLETKLDGTDVVGHGQPFGVFVNLVHTKEIERESGGFGKYLQNQNNSQMYFYNFGRPLENYRDKFRDFATKALADHFEVVSVTFQEATVNSRALPDYGWRMTPYAYLLLKAKGPEVDKLAPLRMDLDFLDTSGYALLPIESPALPIDAKGKPAARPVTDIVVTQTLDERQADKGKLLLEVRATARGLAPELTELLDLKPAGFEIAGIEDRGLAVVEFDKDSPENAVRSERQWTVSLIGATDAEQRPKSFQFGVAKLPVKEMLYQRYEDADLKAVTAEISLESQYGKTSWMQPSLIAAGALAAVAVVMLLWRALAGRPAAAAPQFALPSQLTPFTVIGFLRELESQAGFDDRARQELAQSVAAIERHFFQTPLAEAPDVERIASRWLTAAQTCKAP